MSFAVLPNCREVTVDKDFKGVGMMNIKLKYISAAVIAAFCVALPVMADDIEIYTSGAQNAANVDPNIMFLVDTSTSMGTTILGTDDAPVGYDYTTVYTGSCDPDLIYYATDGLVPSCANSNKDWFNEAALHCDSAYNLYDLSTDPISIFSGVLGPLDSTGVFGDQLAQKDGTSWRPLDTSSVQQGEKDMWIECKVDSGIHGENGVRPQHVYLEDSAGGWTNTAPADLNDPHPIWSGGVNTYKLYHSNYINYRETVAAGGGVAVATADLPTRLDIVKQAIFTLVNSNNNFNLGLMVMDDTTAQWEGGSVQFPSLSTTLTRNDFQNRLGHLTADGMSELSELYYEALLYYGGRVNDYGSNAHPAPSVVSGVYLSGTAPKSYQTPITDVCQKNYIVVVSDGSPVQDYVSATRRTNLASGYDFKCNSEADPDPDHDGFLGTTGTTAVTTADFNKNASASLASTNDNCLDEFAEWASQNDVAQRSEPAHEGDQIVKTYTVGFGFEGTTDPDLLAGKQLLIDTAERGGGEFIEATNQASLDDAFSRIVAAILAVNSTFSSPAVSVNAFNRATNLDDLFFTLFKPTEGEHWEGNLKKFKLEFDANDDPFVADANSAPAIDLTTGFFKASSTSYWTADADAPDGAETATGGAASKITATDRQLITFAGTYSGTGLMTPDDGNLTSAGNELIPDNVTDAMLGGVATNPDVNSGGTVRLYEEALLLWAAGVDIKDFDRDDDFTDDRRVMGDPLHAEPALVQYGEIGTGDAAKPDLVAYVATNDGYLHAFNTEADAAAGTAAGAELFAFVPQELLPGLKNIFEDTGVNGKAYGLDGNVVPWVNDANNNGTIDTGEHVYLYFGMRRGGRYIYSVDVTNRNAPTLRWVIDGGAGDYAEMGQTWSAPNVEKINMGGTDRVVLIFGAGYDTNQDNLIERGIDSVGRGIYIVDAVTGELLWDAGPDDSAAEFKLTEMKYSIPARIKPIDIDSDGYVDRLYVADMGGQLWRFDIDNAANTSSTLSVRGGRIANFAVDNSQTENRRFYNPPDVALIAEPGQAPFISIVAASGYRAHPLQTATHDRIYMFRDHDVYTAPETYTTLIDADLFDTTDNTIGQGTDFEVTAAIDDLNVADGWYINLNKDDGTADGLYQGEKALSEPLILNGVAIITTYIPASAGVSNSSCSTNDGTGAIYFVNVSDGTPKDDGDDQTSEVRDDRRTLLTRGGIPPTPRIIITKDGVAECTGTECSTSDEIGSIETMYWYEVEE